MLRPRNFSYIGRNFKETLKVFYLCKKNKRDVKTSKMSLKTIKNLIILRPMFAFIAKQYKKNPKSNVIRKVPHFPWLPLAKNFI